MSGPKALLATLAGEGKAAQAKLAMLYELHWSEIVRFVSRTFGDGPPDPEDAAQSAFTQFAALEKPEEIENPRAFLYRSARNFVLDQKRRLRVRSRHAQNVIAETFSPAADEPDAQRVLEAKERLSVLEAVVLKLEPRQREALILNRHHGLSYAAIARVKNISEGQAKRLVTKALRACRRALAEADGEPEIVGEGDDE